MPIQTACPNCGKNYNLADAMNGKTVKCKSCAKIFLVGAVAAKAQAPTTSRGTGTAKGPPAKSVAVKTKPKRPADDEVEEVPPPDENDGPDKQHRPVRQGPKYAAGIER